MKNIHVLPTDKPSRTYKIDSIGKLDWSEGYLHQVDGATNQNIYITSDEEINQQTKPCWCINTIKNTWDADLIYYQGSMPQYHYVGFKKIILSTDQDLIKDDVQAIDDEFLEWFVKNQSCESVEVIKQELNTDYRSDWKQKFYYKIIIPKEEPKQHVELINDNIEEFDKAIELFKQETLEEAAERLNPYVLNGRTPFKEGFKDGAKWQQEKSYSEEEVLAFGKSCFYKGFDKAENDDANCYTAFREEIGGLFEQFKKK